VLLEETRPVIVNILQHFGQRTLDEVAAAREGEPKLSLRILFNIAQPLVTRFLASYAGERIRGMIDATTRRRLGEAFVEVYDEGQTFPKLVSAVQSVFEDAGKARAAMIARTETTRASGAAVQSALVQADVKWKGWLSSRDDWVRDTHQRMDGQVREVSEPFVSPSGALGQHPGGFGVKAEDINCRCIELALVNAEAVEEFTGRGKRDREWADREAEMAQLEKELQGAFQRGFERQGERFLAKLTERLGP